MDVMDLLPYALAVFFNGICVLGAVGVLRRARPGSAVGFLDRWDALNRMSDTLFYLLVALILTSWAVFPDVVWYLVLALTAGAAAGVVLCWPRLPTRAGDRGAATRRFSAIGTLAFLAAAVVALLVFT